MKKASAVFSSSSRALKNNSSTTSQSPRSKGSSSQTRRSSIFTSGSQRKVNTVGQSFSQTPKRAVRVLDDEGKDVTPRSLYRAEPEHVQPSPSTAFLDEIFPSSGSYYSKSASSFNAPSFSSFMDSNRPPNRSTKASQTMETDDSVSKQDISIKPPHEVLRKRDKVKHVTEEMLDELVHICLSETDTISLLDILPTHVSEDAGDADAIKQSNTEYVELCKNRRGNDKYVERSMQTLTGAPKSKEFQSDEIVMVGEGTMATVWDIYDSFCDQNQTPDRDEGTKGTASSDKEKKGEMSSSGTGGTDFIPSGSTMSSLLETELNGSSVNAEPDPKLIMLSESFQHSLLVIERSILANVFQPRLAAYRQLPVLEDPNSTVKPAADQQSEDGEETLSSPTLEHLWTFSCELTEGENITCMAWNKENTDLLAVGYSEYGFINLKPGLICCWSLKNPTWPERVFHCHSGVTSMDFSANNPSQLAVGMFDGTVAIYDVQSRNKTCVIGSSKCSKRHLHPVWQILWTKQDVGLSGEDRDESLVSVSADGRITKWLVCGEGLNCIDLMTLRRPQNPKKKAAGKKKKDSVLSAVTPGLCVDFHPANTGVYLVGTREGLIQKFSFFDSQNTLETYKKHICPVNHVEWSPFYPDAYLSCSSDWTIHLWKQDRCSPVLSFTSSQSAVNAIRWSPNCSTVFAAVNEQQVEIWDLNSSLLYPTIVLHPAPPARWTSLLFARGTDCVLVGDSVGQVAVYQLKNLRVGAQQVDRLEDIIHSAVSR